MQLDEINPEKGPDSHMEDHVYDDIGRALRAIARGYRQAYEAATGKSGPAATGKKVPALKG